MFMQSHTDLRPPPRTANASSFTGRTTRPGDSEQVIVEYIQSGDVLFTGADSSCAGTASLLRAEKAAGTYLSGLGCSSVGKGGKGGPFLSKPGKGPTATGRGSSASTSRSGGSSNSEGIAPRALICIDSETGKRYKAIPIEGAIEAVHAAGHYIIVAVAPLEDYPNGSLGSLVVVDFTQEGFGITDAQRAQQAGEKKGSGAGISGGAGGAAGDSTARLKGASGGRKNQNSSAQGGAGGSSAAAGGGSDPSSRSGGSGGTSGKSKRPCRRRGGGSDDK